MLFVIPLPPVTKKNSQRIIKVNGRPIIIPSAKYVAYEREAIKHLQAYLGGKEPPKITYPCNIECKFYMPTHRAVDRANLEQAIQDVLVRAGILEDDNRDIAATSDGTEVLYDKDNPRTVINITRKHGYEQWNKRYQELNDHFLDPTKKEENK